MASRWATNAAACRRATSSVEGSASGTCVTVNPPHTVCAATTRTRDPSQFETHVGCLDGDGLRSALEVCRTGAIAWAPCQIAFPTTAPP